MKIENNQAIVNARSLSISTKMSIEICRVIRNKNIKDAKRMLNDIVEMKRALPLVRFKRDVAHKRGKIAAGRYPINTGTQFLNLLDSVQKNAENKGLDTNNLIISFAKADRAEAKHRSGSKRRTGAKNTHVSLVVTEIENKEKKK